MKTLPIFAQIALDRLEPGTILCANATKRIGSGFFYFTIPDGQPFPTTAAKYLIRHGYVEPAGDAMFRAASQTYRLKEIP